MNNIASFGQLFTNLNQVIFTLRNELEGLRNEIVALKSQVNNKDDTQTNQALTEVKKMLETLTTEVQQLTTSSISNNDRFDKNENALQTIETSVTSLTSRINTVEMKEVPQPVGVTREDIQVMIDHSMGLLLSDITTPTVEAISSESQTMTQVPSDIIVDPPSIIEDVVVAADEDIPPMLAKATRGRGRGRGKKATS